jgi:D-lactate dehydrogenase
MIKVLVTSSKPFEREVFENILKQSGNAQIQWSFNEMTLDSVSAAFAKDFSVICPFVTDHLDAPCLKKLAEGGTRLIALRSAGFNHVDLKAAKDLGLTLVRVPRYSPHAVAEFAVGLYLCLNRKIHRAHDRVKEGNFSVNGLIGHDIYKQTIGIVGGGAIGKCAAQIFKGFGSRVLVHDLSQDKEWASRVGIEYVRLEDLLKLSDVISLHVPLNSSTRHLINQKSISQMKNGSYLINTSRGGLVDTPALIAALKSKQLCGAALDVYEEEEHIFFKDHSDDIIDDDQFAILNTFPNVLITSHQAFLTYEALQEIASITIKNITSWDSKQDNYWKENAL